MFTLKKTTTASAFICQQRTGVIALHPEVSFCLVAFDTACYSDALFTQLSIPFPDALKSAVTKRQADYLAGRCAASQLLKEAGCNDAVPMGSDRAPVWPPGWCGSISHTEKWAIAILAPYRSHIKLGVDIEKLRPEVMQEIAATFTTARERELLATSSLPYENALLIAFSAKESLFKALYPQVQHIFGFEAARLCELNTNNNRFTLELTMALAPNLNVGYRTDGYYLMREDNVITLIV